MLNEQVFEWVVDICKRLPQIGVICDFVNSFLTIFIPARVPSISLLFSPTVIENKYVLNDTFSMINILGAVY